MLYPWPQVVPEEALTGSRLAERARALADAFEVIVGRDDAELLHALLLSTAARSADPGESGDPGGAEAGPTGDLPPPAAMEARSAEAVMSKAGTEAGTEAGPETSPPLAAGSTGAGGGTAGRATIEELPGGGVLAILQHIESKDTRRVRAGG